ncbi:hypothetical protein AB8615_08710 [Litorimonas sp. RW-G-Af-16]|uniref:hypothetical protein n=1 Tax=Litorimonas sp. RW-G-Af-16 TaxID=3241168 RepID=UPI003AB04AE7
MPKLTGHCLCGQVSFEADGDIVMQEIAIARIVNRSAVPPLQRLSLSKRMQ